MPVERTMTIQVAHIRPADRLMVVVAHDGISCWQMTTPDHTPANTVEQKFLPRLKARRATHTTVKFDDGHQVDMPLDGTASVVRTVATYGDILDRHRGDVLDHASRRLNATSYDAVAAVMTLVTDRQGVIGHRPTDLLYGADWRLAGLLADAKTTEWWARVQAAIETMVARDGVDTDEATIRSVIGIAKQAEREAQRGPDNDSSGHGHRFIATCIYQGTLKFLDGLLDGWNYGTGVIDRYQEALADVNHYGRDFAPDPKP